MKSQSDTEYQHPLIKHGDNRGGRRHRLYNIFHQMRARCFNPKKDTYVHYGGRGITVCEEWAPIEGYPIFKRWAMENGYQDGLELDRMDNDGPYSPDNCRWVTRQVNLGNMRRNIRVTAFGETKILSEWMLDERCKVNRTTLNGRLEAGWNPDEAMTLPAYAKAGIRSTNVKVTAFDETKTLAQWVRDPRCVVHRNTVVQRLKYGWDVEAAITAPSTRS